MIYYFCDAVYNPDAVTKLTVDGIEQHITFHQSRLLQFLLDNNEQVIHYDRILLEVWGDVERSYSSISSAVTSLNQVLPVDGKVLNTKYQGYGMQVDLNIEHPKYEKTELLFTKSRFIRLLSAAGMFGFVAYSVSGLGSWTGASRWLNPPPVYSLDELDDAFTHNNVVNFPQLSRDSLFVLHQLANKLYEDDYLALTDLTKVETRRLVKMRYDDGYEWDLAGNRIVYQVKTATSCQIRLLELDEAKAITKNSFLTECMINSGSLSFAWIDEHEFYVNMVDRESSGSPLHHLYRFDIKSKKATKLITAKAESGIGFYLLEYDQTTDALYMLKTKDGTSADFYRFDADGLSKLTTVDHLVLFFTVANDQLIYKNDKNELVLNRRASNFADQQILFPSPLMPIFAPHFNGHKLAFMAGNTFGYVLNKKTGTHISNIELTEFNPTVIANYDGTLIFASNQAGTYQIYRVAIDGQVIKISDIPQNERIKYITVAGDIFAVSYEDKVRFYQYRQGMLELLATLPGYTNAFLHADGQRVLLSTADAKGATGGIVQMQLNDLQPELLGIKGAVAAMYYNDDVIYVDRNSQLVSFRKLHHQVLASDINISHFVQTAMQQHKLYYIASKAGANQLFVYDFITNERSQVALDSATPTRVTLVNDDIYIRSRQVLKPKLMIGEIHSK